MRVLADTNIFISYLLNPGRAGAIETFFQAVMDVQITLLLPQNLVAEIISTVTSKPYLAKQIDRETLDALLAALALSGETIPSITAPIPRMTRDPKDDYLIAYAVIGGADFLVTGDKDLLVLGKFGDLDIITVQELVSTRL